MKPRQRIPSRIDLINAIVEPFEAFVRRKLDQLTDAKPDRTKALEAQIAELKEALRPLAECEIIEPDVPIPDDHGARYFITYREIRRARARLKEADR